MDGGPKIFTIAPHLRFTDRLAAGLLRTAGPDPLSLSHIRIFVPHRRAARALREAFLRQGAGEAIILPRINAVGDVEEDALTLRGVLEDDLTLPPAISPTRRRLLLMRLVLRFLAANSGEAHRPGALAPALAADLARLIDDFHREGVRFADLQDAVPGDFSRHWQQTLDFLGIAFTAWPAVLAEEGALDPADRRNRLIRAQALRWRDEPPPYRVIAAGSTGSLPATAELLSVIARLPQGCVILPGLDRDMDPESWDALSPTHPQFGMKALLDGMRADRADVADWPGPPDPSGAARTALLYELMRPSETAALWRHYTPPAAALQGLARLDLEDGAEEAEVIALILREALETPSKTAALVTPDRALARRVIAALKRWDIAVNDSGGLALAHTPLGSVLNLIADLLLVDWTPARLLSLLKHPLAGLGLALPACRGLARALELAALRGPRPAPGIAGLKAALEPQDRDLLEFVARLETAIAPLSGLSPTASLADFAAAHVATAEALAATDAEAGAARLWQGDAGEAAAALFEDLIVSGADIPLAGDIYPALLRQFLTEAVIRPRYGLHPRLFVWSPMEARLQRADVTILGGLNEGTWPGEAEPSAWLSRPMQRQLGLPLPERQIGLSAHDFLVSAAGPAVYLTRALKADGVPTVPSRWLLRLQALTGAAQGSSPWAQWREALNRPARFASPRPPAPCPPVTARPDKLSVTDVETWMRDPYALYARKILALRPLEPIDAQIDAAARGTLIHAVLDAFVAEGLADGAWQEERLVALAEAAFDAIHARPLLRVLWRPRLRRLAPWLVAELETAAAAGRRPLLLEKRREWTFDVDGAPFTLVAKADRLDEGPEGLTIVDYKTGAVPKDKQIAAGYAPQLPLEALMVEAGVFDARRRQVAGLEYWAIKGTAEIGRISDVKDKDARIAQAQAGLIAMIRRFRDPATPYLSQPAPEEVKGDDYDHLARVREWREGGSE